MIATLIASIVSGEASETMAGARRAVVFYAAAAVLILCGLGFLVGAGFIVLSQEIGSLAAALWFGGGFILAGLILVMVHRIMARARAKEATRRRNSEMAAVAGAAAFAALPALLSGRGRAAALIAPVIAGLAFAVYRENRPRTRKDDPLR